MRCSSITPLWTCMVLAAILLLNNAEAAAVGVPSPHACQQQIDAAPNDGSMSSKECRQSPPQDQTLSEHSSDLARRDCRQGASCMEQGSVSTAVNLRSSVSMDSSSSASIGGSEDDPPRGGAGGTEAMAVVKTESTTNDSEGHGSGIYHGGPSKAHMEATSLASSSSGGQKMVGRCAVGSQGAVAVVASVAGLWMAATFL
ncbi:MAG: hypothetical protein J3R72DRAFT_439522 [Linnemannia gamsii]|nr:MAG: hypothetical protein J3R72DRAFT_439522 [Linnemannia gamsii]